MPSKKNQEQYGFRCIFCAKEVNKLPDSWLRMSSAVICGECTDHLNIDAVHEPVPCTIVAARRDPENPLHTIITVDAAFLPDTLIGNRANITVKFTNDEQTS